MKYGEPTYLTHLKVYLTPKRCNDDILVYYLITITHILVNLPPQGDNHNIGEILLLNQLIYWLTELLGITKVITIILIPWMHSAASPRFTGSALQELSHRDLRRVSSKDLCALLQSLMTLGGEGDPGAGPR